MAEPFVYRIHEIADMTDRQIRMAIEGQRKATESVKGADDGPKAFDEPDTVNIGTGDYVSEREAKAFMADVESKIYL